MSIDFWRPFIAKILAPFIGFAVTYLNKKYGIVFSDADTAGLVAQITDLLVFAVSTGITAVGINKWANPGNAASSHLAAAEKAESQEIKSFTDQYKAQK